MTEADHRQDMLRDEALDWLARLSLGEATREDLSAIRKWRDTSPAHAAALAEARQLWNDLAAPVEALAHEAAAAPAANRAMFRPSRRALIGGGAAVAAASAAGVMMVRPPLELWPSLAELASDHRTGVGEQQHLALADDVTVDLNTKTSIALRTTGQDAGIELISGETAIAVGKSATRPFVVVAGDGRITAFQAAFNVRRDGSSVHLTCIDGTIAVACSGRELPVRASQQVSYSDTGLGDLSSVDPASVTAWREGILIFRNTPLVDVIEEVNRYRPGRIILIDRKLGPQPVTARFEIKRLDTVMGQIGSVFNVPVKRLLGGIVLVG
jgi:transmembrane sensor